jgi:uncharacterized 2Fe-2S/4Fe-4S cluster protein (DUF4445 family)
MNPQIRFGEDLMSRVSYAMMNPGGARQMTDAVRSALSELARRVAHSAGVTPQDILEVTLVGTPSCTTWCWASIHGARRRPVCTGR